MVRNTTGTRSPSWRSRMKPLAAFARRLAVCGWPMASATTPTRSSRSVRPSPVMLGEHSWGMSRSVLSSRFSLRSFASSSRSTVESTPTLPLPRSTRARSTQFRMLDSVRSRSRATGGTSLAGGSVEKLSKMLGHHSVVMTERSVHLRPDLFAERDLAAIPLDLGPGVAVPVQIGANLGPANEARPRKASNHAYFRRLSEQMPEPPCKPGANHCRYGSRSGATGRDKWAETLERARLAATGRAARAPSYGRLRQKNLPESERHSVAHWPRPSERPS